MQKIKSTIGEDYKLADGWEKRVSHYAKSMADADLIERDKVSRTERG